MSPPRDCVPALIKADLHAMADWASERPIRHGWKGRTCRELWDAVPRGDWLLEWAAQAGADFRSTVRAASECARAAALPAIDDPSATRHVREGLDIVDRWTEDPSHINRRSMWAVGMSLDGEASLMKSRGARALGPDVQATESVKWIAMGAGNACPGGIGDRDRRRLIGAGVAAAERAAVASAQTRLMGLCADLVRLHVAYPGDPEPD